MRELAHVLLHEPNSLTPGERELIATYVLRKTTAIFASPATARPHPVIWPETTWCAG